MRNALFASAAMHLVAIVMAAVGLPALFDPDPPQDVTIVVEVVTAPHAAREKPPTPPRPSPPKPAPAKKPPPAPAPPKQAAPPEPAPKPEPAPVKKAEPEPAPPKPKPAHAPEPEVAKRPPPPKDRPKPAEPDAFQTLLKNLADQKRRRDEEEPDKKQQVAAVEPPPQPEVSDIDRRRQQATLAQMINQQVTPCWNIPAGAKDAHRMRVGVRVFLNADGSLRGSPRLEDADRIRRDPFFRAVAESAIRALYNPRCSPLRLPPDQYELWKEITFNFDPREALQ